MSVASAASSSSSQPTADRHLLFGIVAVQMDFIGREACRTRLWENATDV